MECADYVAESSRFKVAHKLLKNEFEPGKRMFVYSKHHSGWWQIQMDYPVSGFKRQIQI